MKLWPTKTTLFTLVATLIALGLSPSLWAIPTVKVINLQGSKAQTAKFEKLTTEMCRELETELGLSPQGTLHLHLVQSTEAFSDLVYRLARSRPPIWSLAVAIPSQMNVVIQAHKLDILQNPLISTLKHELVHIYLGAIPQASQFPRYLDEGLATWYGRRIPLQKELQDLETRARHDQLIPFVELERSFPPHTQDANLAYIQSLSLVSYMIREYGRDRLQLFLSDMEGGQPFSRALENRYGLTPKELEEEWKKSLISSTWALQFIFNEITLFALMGLLVVFGVFRQRSRSKAILRKWEEEEQLEDEYGW